MSMHALSVASFFIKRAARDQQALTPMKLIKLVYIAHGWELGFSGHPLINELVEAWKYGPVIRSIYRYFSDYGGSSIDPAEADNLPISPIEGKTSDFLNSVWNIYARFDGLQLSTFTHQPQTPWYKIWHQDGGSRRSSAIIPNEDIQKYYQRLIHERQST